MIKQGEVFVQMVEDRPEEKPPAHVVSPATLPKPRSRPGAPR
jgi:hypothetical protein